jgi:general secretion pathway protein A
MNPLYQDFFGLSQAPFNITPDPGFLYLSTSHREGLAQLTYGIKSRKGFVVLTGEVGTGKTTLIHTLLKELGPDTQTALIFSPIGNQTDLLRYVCEDFAITDPRRPLNGIHDYLVLLNEYLLAKYRSGENCVLIIDEAQNLSFEVLESIRLLSNFETSKDKLLQILLAGQPELATRLNSQELRQLKQRIALRHNLRALTIQECQEYISNRLKIANGNPDIFTPSGIEAVYSYSKGIPRIINVLGDNALLTAFALGRDRVDARIVHEVAEDLSLGAGSAVQLRSIPLKPNVRINPPSSEMNHRSAERPPVIQVPVDPPVAQANQKVGGRPEGKVEDFVIRELVGELTDAMGPMASIVLQDNVKRLGQSATNFPPRKLSALIEAVSGEILDPSARRTFCKSALDRVKAIGAE